MTAWVEEEEHQRSVTGARSFTVASVVGAGQESPLLTGTPCSASLGIAACRPIDSALNFTTDRFLTGLKSATDATTTIPPASAWVPNVPTGAARIQSISSSNRPLRTLVPVTDEDLIGSTHGLSPRTAVEATSTRTQPLSGRKAAAPVGCVSTSSNWSDTTSAWATSALTA